MGIFIGILISYLTLGYAALKSELQKDAGDQIPIVRDGQYFLYVLAWPLPLIISYVLIPNLIKKKTEIVKIQAAERVIQDFRNGFLYGQREAVIIALCTIVTKFNTTRAHEREVIYVEKIRKLLGVNASDSLYQEILSHRGQRNFITYISSMNQEHRDYMCLVIEKLFDSVPVREKGKTDVAQAILSDIGVTKEEYKKAMSVSKFNAFL